MALANIEFIQYMHQLLETQVIDCYVITCTNILLMLVFDISVFCKQMLTLIYANRVAGLGRLSAGANMAMKPFVKREITIFATNALFLRVISNFRI